MLPRRCIQPPCMNMAVKMVMAWPPGLAAKRAGTNAHALMNASPPLSSSKNTSTFTPISP